MTNHNLFRYFEIKEFCRKGLIKYLFEAVLPEFENPQILDIGCENGTL